MPTSPPRRTFEKSSTVRRRYQRSNKRLQFSASQIARIEREEERVRKAKILREQEKRRVANRKKKAEKEAKAREERRRLGLPDPYAATVPSSQPLLFNFLKKGDSASVAPEAETATPGEETDPGETTEAVEDSESSAFEKKGVVEDEFGDADVLLEDDVQGDTLETGSAGADGSMRHEGDREDPSTETKEDDEFSDCSVFYDEDILKRVENITPAVGMMQQELQKPPPPPPPPQPERTPISLPGGESFCDDTAILLEEFGCEFDTDEEFERELAQLDAV